MLEIEILESGKMSTTGDTVLKALQNNSMPHADLLVRESIQNSLDAAASREPVKVDFQIGNFDAFRFNILLDKVSDSLNKKYQGYQKFLSIRDENTVGLTGPLTHEEVLSDDNYGNFIKLVYEISKPQTKEGAGGSWGYGKSIYYRMGSGIVVFYSRIKQDGSYQERLAIACVEKVDDQGILPRIGNLKTGIAWWGEKNGVNKTKPITDPQTIDDVLTIFGIQRYKDDETGTTIIMPYIDEGKILKHNRNLDIVDEQYDDLSEYLSVAIQRWYAPRLNNTNYTYGAPLNASINGNYIVGHDQLPIFSLIKNLYNKSQDPISVDGYVVEKITIIEPKLENRLVGTLIHKLVPYNELGMDSLVDAWNPTYQTSLLNKHENELDQSTLNAPIFMYTRRPGMIVSYESTGEWLKRVKNFPKDQYLVAIFVANSENMINLNGESYNFDEYIRKGEQADHTGWSDHAEFGDRLDIIRKIQNHVGSKLSKFYNDTEEAHDTSSTSGKISALLGESLLPKMSFGSTASKDKKKIREKKIVRQNNDSNVTIFDGEVSYISDGLRIPFLVHFLDEVKEVEFKIYIAQAGSAAQSIEAFEEKSGIKSPLSIGHIEITSPKENRVLKSITDKSKKFNFHFSNIDTMHKVVYFPSEEETIIEGVIEIKAEDRNFMPDLRITLLDIESDGAI